MVMSGKVAFKIFVVPQSLLFLLNIIFIKHKIFHHCFSGVTLYTPDTQGSGSLSRYYDRAECGGLASN